MAVPNVESPFRIKSFNELTNVNANDMINQALAKSKNTKNTSKNTSKNVITFSSSKRNDLSTNVSTKKNTSAKSKPKQTTKSVDASPILNNGHRMKKIVTKRGYAIYKDIDTGLYYNNLQQNINEGKSKEEFSKENNIVFTSSSTTKSKSKPSTNKYTTYRLDATKSSTNNTNKTTSSTPKRNNLASEQSASTKSTKKNNTTTKLSTTRTYSSSTPEGNYTVSKGDSLWQIAHNNGISLNELMRQNPQIKNINQVIHPGDKINVNNSNTTVDNTATNNSSKPNIEDIDLGENNNEVTEKYDNKIREVRRSILKDQIKQGNPIRKEYFAEATSDIRPEIGTIAEDVARTYTPGTLAPSAVKMPTYKISSKKRKRK